MSYKSVFVPDMDIEDAQYITELLILNYLQWQKSPKPNSPFWRKEYQTNAELEALGKRYVADLTAVRDLLKVFAPKVLIQYFTEKKLPSIRILKAENRDKAHLELIRRQIDYVKNLEIEYKAKFEKMPDKIKYLARTGNSLMDI